MKHQSEADTAYGWVNRASTAMSQAVGMLGYAVLAAVREKRALREKVEALVLPPRPW